LPAALDLAGFNGGYRVAPLFKSENLIEPGRPMQNAFVENFNGRAFSAGKKGGHKESV